MRRNNSGVSQLPPTIGIKDPETRNFLDALSNAWQLRNGDFEPGSGQRFVTRDELGSIVGEEVTGIFTGANGGIFGEGGNNSGIDITQLIQNLSDEISKGLAAQYLKEFITPIDLDRVRSRITELIGKVDKENARVVGALREAIDSTRNKIDGLELGVTSKVNRVTTALSDEITKTEGLKVRIDNNEAAILNETTVRAQQDQAAFSQINAVSLRVDTNTADILSTRDLVLTTNEATLNEIDGVSIRVDQAELDIVNERTARVSADSNLLTITSATSQKVAQNEVQFTNSINSLVTQQNATVTQLTGLTTRVGAAESAIVSETNARVAADSVQTSRTDAISSRLGTAEAGLLTEQNQRVSKDAALATAIQTVFSAVGGNSSAVQDTITVDVNQAAALAAKKTQVEAALTDPATGTLTRTSIVQDFKAYTNKADGTFNSLYGVKVQTDYAGRQVVGGFALAATAGAGSASGSTIDFGVAADRFFLSAPTSSAPASMDVPSLYPFIVITTPQTINGATYPVGAYIKTAAIGDASITNAKIGNVIQSNNYVAGSSGWQIRKDGFAEFSNVVVRGDITANRVIAGSIVTGSIANGAVSSSYLAVSSGPYTQLTVAIPAGAYALILCSTDNYTPPEGAPLHTLGLVGGSAIITNNMLTPIIYTSPVAGFDTSFTFYYQSAAAGYTNRIAALVLKR